MACKSTIFSIYKLQVVVFDSNKYLLLLNSHVLFSEENNETTRNSFLGLPDVDMDKSESEIDKVVEELEGLAGLKLSSGF